VPRNPLHASITYGGQRQYHRWVNGTIPITNGLKLKNKENPDTQKMKTNVLMVKNQKRTPFKTILTKWAPSID
jgi:hypothetical protein